MKNPFRYFKTSPEVIRLAVMMYIRFPLSLRQVEDLHHERGIDICHETVRVWWNRFGPKFAAEIRKKRSASMRAHIQWRWHLDEVFVRINGVTHYLWRAVDHEGEVLESFVTKKRDRKAALRFLKKAMKRYGRGERYCLASSTSFSAIAEAARRYIWRSSPCVISRKFSDAPARLEFGSHDWIKFFGCNCIAFGLGVLMRWSSTSRRR